MTVPEGWKSEEKPKFSSSLMPRPSLLTRSMVGLQDLRIRRYAIQKMEMIEQETKAITPTSKLKYFEIQPIESMYIQDIIEIKVSSYTKGRFMKKEDLVIEIRSLGPQDRRQYVTRIDLDDKYALTR